MSSTDHLLHGDYYQSNCRRLGGRRDNDLCFIVVYQYRAVAQCRRDSYHWRALDVRSFTTLSCKRGHNIKKLHLSAEVLFCDSYLIAN